MGATMDWNHEVEQLEAHQREVVEDLVLALRHGLIDDRRLRFLAMEIREYLERVESKQAGDA